MRTRTIRELGDPITIREGEVPGGFGLGAFNERTGEIVINPDQPEIGKQITLVHELLHVVDASMVRAGITKRRTSHAWIESGATNLFLLLVLSGLYTGVTRRAMLKFVREYVPDPPKRPARKRRTTP